MTEQLIMTWRKYRCEDWPEWTIPAGYLLRSFRAGDGAAYMELMRLAGFDSWGRDNLDLVLKTALPEGVVFVEHIVSSRIVATAMGCYRPSAVLPDAYEMGWVAAHPEHRGIGLCTLGVSPRITT